jgi:receptor-type tyrosine-protein phosphatase F
LIPINYQISYDAYKEFVDAQGVTQAVRIPKITILVSHNTHEYTIKDLSPFTTYHVNVTAVPEGRNYRPPAKITVTTQMAAPQPMVKPDFFGVKKETPGVITVYLPQASEEYGPISHYYLVVIPHANSTRIKHPDYYESADLIANSKNPSGGGGGGGVTTIGSNGGGGGGKGESEPEGKPYITAKFLQRSLPYTFPLGDGKSYEVFENRPLERSVVYKIFVRAYVDVPQKHLYTSSPFSPALTLDMPFGKVFFIIIRKATLIINMVIILTDTLCILR